MDVTKKHFFKFFLLLQLKRVQYSQSILNENYN